MYIDKVCFTRKPTDKETAFIQNRKKDHRSNIKLEAEYDLEEIKAAVEKGQTIIYSNHFSKDTGYFILDIDSNPGAITTTIDFFKRCDSLNIQRPNLVYKTFSYTREVPRFRAIWELSKRLSDKEYKSLYSWMIERFNLPTLDKSCSTIEKLFFGSVKGGAVLLHKETLKVEDLDLEPVKEYTPMKEIEYSGELEEIIKKSNGVKKILKGYYGYQEALSIIAALKKFKIDIGGADITEIIQLWPDYSEAERQHRERGMREAWANDKVYVPGKGTPGAELSRYLYVAKNLTK